MCIIKSRYHNIGVILIFIMSFNIEDTSIIFHSNKLYASWLAVTTSGLISTKKQRFEENVSFNKRNCLPRDQGQPDPQMSLKALFRRISNRKGHSFLTINYLTILYFSGKGLENINATIEDIYVCIREY